MFPGATMATVGIMHYLLAVLRSDRNHQIPFCPALNKKTTSHAKQGALAGTRKKDRHEHLDPDSHALTRTGRCPGLIELAITIAPFVLLEAGTGVPLFYAGHPF